MVTIQTVCGPVHIGRQRNIDKYRQRRTNSSKYCMFTTCKVRSLIVDCFAPDLRYSHIRTFHQTHAVNSNSGHDSPLPCGFCQPPSLPNRPYTYLKVHRIHTHWHRFKCFQYETIYTLKSDSNS